MIFKLSSFVKSVFEPLLAFILLLFLSPLLVFLSFLVYLSSPGPVFFVQKRIGIYGRHFSIFKFRTMFLGSEADGSGLFSFKDDPRITPIGHFLRSTSLDELPQLFNILNGSMSFVGPRPPVTYELGPFDNYPADLKTICRKARDYRAISD